MIDGYRIGFGMAMDEACHLLKPIDVRSHFKILLGT